MRIFISSVRRGLEEERDALPGLIAAIGHEAVRFEDLSARPTPSREVCVRGVRSCDAYLLLLGPHYGFAFADTGQSPTHDEWNAALAGGLPRLVMRKRDVALDPDQAAFVAHVSSYTSGVFYAEFTTTAELLIEVAAAVRDLASRPTRLDFRPLREPVSLSWRSDHAPLGARDGSGQLELHVLPLGDEGQRTTRELAELEERVVAGLRNTATVPHSLGLTPSRSTEAVSIELPGLRSPGFNEARAASMRGIRVSRAGQVTIWWDLPRDTLGALLDSEDLQEMISSGLRLVGALKLVAAERAACAVGLSSTAFVSEGRVTGVGRTSATMGHRADAPLQMQPDESVSIAAFDEGAAEVADVLVRSLLDAFRGP